MKKSISLKMFLLILLASFSVISCANKENKKLRSEIMDKLTEDVVLVFDIALNSVTAGLGAKIVNMAVSKEGKEKMIKDNLLPQIKKELDKENDTKKLEDLNANKVKRYSFALNSFVKNSDEIKKNLSGVTAKIYDGIIDYLKKENK